MPLTSCVFLFNSKACLPATICSLQHHKQSNSAYTTSELGLSTSFSASTSLFSTPVSTVLKLLLSVGWGFFGGVCILNELCGLPTSKASLLSPPFTGCPLARPKTKGYKLSQQRSRSMQCAGMQPVGQSWGLLERGFGGIRQGDCAELCRGAPGPGPHPCLHSNQVQIQHALQTSSCLKHISPSPLPSLLRCLLGEEKETQKHPRY